MNQDQETESLENAADDADQTVSVDDFIRQLEAKEKDLHITAETTIIEISEGFDDGELPDFLKEEFPGVAVTSVKPSAAAAAPAPKDDAKLRKLEAEVKDLRDSSAKLEVEKTELTKDIQRHAKDLANYRQRIDRERRESFQNQVGNLATQMLPVLDNLNRAIDYAIDHDHTKDEEFRPFFDGVFLVNQQLNEVLGEMGITPIATVGEQFDPHLHEAAATQETDEWPSNAICEELLKGYRIGERVIRHSVVKVAKPLPGAEPSVLDKLFEGEAESAEAAPEEPSKEIELTSDDSENSPE